MRPHTRIALAFLLALAGSLHAAGPHPAAGPDPARKPAAPPAWVEAHLTDGGTMKVILADERIELTTRYGTLLIPVADVQGIDVGRRLTAEVARRIETAVRNLGSKEFRDRKAAADELVGLRDKAYPAVVEATKSSDAEVAHTAEDILAKIKEEVPEELLEVPETDTVYTADSKIAGRITGASLKVHTAQFGDQDLKLTDVHSLRLVSAELVKAEPGPENLIALQGQVGKTFHFRVTGTTDGPVWGTDVYTTDSSLATAAVHAGAVKAGQTGVVRVTIVPPPPMFDGTVRNGITSQPWPAYPGAFRVQAVK